MKSIEVTGKTVDDAVSEALEALGTTRDKVSIEILDEGAKGLFGFIGNKEAKLRVTVNELSTEDIIKDTVDELIKKMGVEATSEITTDDAGRYAVSVSGEKVSALIGHRGEALDAMQYLVSLIVNKDREEYVKLTIDVEGYRQRREESLKRLAKKNAERALKIHRNVSFEPMNPYERRIIHEALQEYEDLTTYSTGYEPNRRVVIAYKPQDK